MSEEQLLGNEHPAEPAPEPPKTYEGGMEGLKEAARDLREERSAPDEGEPVKPGPARSVTAEGAAAELSAWRREEAEAVEQNAKEEFAWSVDLARAGFNSSFADLKTQEDVNRLAAENPERYAEFQKHIIRTATQEQPVQGETQLQPETPIDEPVQGLDPEVAEALKRPKVRSLIEAVAAGAEQQRQASGQLVQAFADMTRSVLLGDHPELAGMTAPQFNGAMAMLAKTDPAKHANIMHKVNLAMAGAQAVDQERAVKAQWDQQRFQQWSKNEDRVFDEKTPELTDRAARTRVSEAAVKTLHGVGFSDEELAPAWQGAAGFSLRDHRVQLVLMKAALYDEAKAGIGRPAQKPFSPVQRPGVAATSIGASDDDIQNLRQQLRGAKGMASIRIAARLHSAQRRARG